VLPRRTCAALKQDGRICGAVLSAYNSGPDCQPCRNAQTLRNFESMSTNFGDRRAAIIAVLERGPATVAVLTAATFATDKAVREDLVALIADGKVERGSKELGVRHYRIAVDAASLMDDAA
jgi:hypothetical protein